MPFDGASKLLDDPVIGRLTVARQKIADGWCQGVVTRRNRLTGHVSYCLWGALDDRDRLLVGNIVKDHTGLKWIRIEGWNDEPSRTKADVLAMIDCAIDRRRRELLDAL